MKTNTLAFVVSIVLFCNGLAQNPIVTPIQNWTYYRHASTAEEGVLQGAAAAIQAVGQANYMHSIAAVNYAEAQRQQIENSRLYVKTVLDNREYLYNFRERYTRPPISKEQWQEFSKRALPSRLTSDQYSDGKLVWPHILRMDEYTPLRKRIDVLVANRTPENSGDGSPFQREIASHVDAMKILLRQNLDTLSSSQYGHARWFLVCLDYEMKQPLTTVSQSSSQSSVDQPQTSSGDAISAVPETDQPIH